MKPVVIAFPLRPQYIPTAVIYAGAELTKDEWAMIVKNEHPQADQDEVDRSWAEVYSLYREGKLPDQKPAAEPIPFPLKSSAARKVAVA